MPGALPRTRVRAPNPRSRVAKALPWWRRAAYAVLVGLLVLSGLAGFVVAFAASTLPGIDGLGAVAGSVRILDRSGALIA